MKSLNHSLRAMASFFASYLLDRFGDNIRQIFLFGSVARGEATADSDIDIFVDVSNIKSRILPGLILILSAPLSIAARARRKSKCISATNGILINCLILEIALTESISGTATLTSSHPEDSSFLICRRVARTSLVSVFVILCTRMGWVPPRIIFPTFTSLVLRRMNLFDIFID